MATEDKFKSKVIRLEVLKFHFSCVFTHTPFFLVEGMGEKGGQDEGNKPTDI